jgi:hypothetical protein
VGVAPNIIEGFSANGASLDAQFHWRVERFGFSTKTQIPQH